LRVLPLLVALELHFVVLLLLTRRCVAEL